MKRFQIVQHNSYINSRQVITKKKCQFHWISSHSFNRFGPFQARSELQHKTALALGIVWGAGIFYCNSWNTLDNCPIKIPSLEGIISYSQASIARRKPGRQYLISAFIRDIQLMNDSPVSWSRHSPGSWREGERKWTWTYLYLQGRHEYSSKHSSSLFNKRYLCQHTRHSCFNCSIRVEMNRQQLLGVAREVQSFSSPSLNNR